MAVCIMMMILAAVAVVGLLAILRAAMCLPKRVFRFGRGAPRRQKRVSTVMVVLGSGGHTTEMLRMLEGLDGDRFSPRHYVVADTDRISSDKAHAHEASRTAPSSYTVHVIPRSREVGQSYVSSLWTTGIATLSAARLFARVMPDVLICNGPGTCIPLCMCAWLLRFVGVHDTTIVFVESFARVESLSLTGRLLYRVADTFHVQWQQLYARYPLATYRGFLI